MAKDHFCDLEDIAEVTGLSVDELRGYAGRGWLDGGRDEGQERFWKNDSIWRCGLIDHLRKDFGFTDEEVEGALEYMDTVKIARMGGGRVKERYCPFERELAKAGPVWISAPQGDVSPEEPVHFTVHGEIDPLRLDYLLVRSDAVLAHRGRAETFELLGKKYARGTVPAGLPFHEAGGTYRIHLAGCASYGFRISKDARARFIELGLRYFRGTRCGERTEFHPACHLDDGIRDDTNGYYPLVGGWHDAGDFCHITSTTAASYYLAKALEATEPGERYHQVLFDEAMHGADYNLRARDTRTGKVFENKGVGRGGFGGRFGDNQRLTDNIVLSGDERHIRTNGSIETAMDCLSALAVMARVSNGPGRFRESCLEAGEKGWRFHANQEDTRVYHKAKRVIAALEWYRTTGEDSWAERMRRALDELIGLVDSDGDVVDLDGKIFLEHYQHGSPLVALAQAAESTSPHAERAGDAARRLADRLVELAGLQPYGVTCYAVTKREHIETYTNQDTVNRWHPLGGGKAYRMYQPFTGRFWQGSVSQLSLLGVGLAILARVTGRREYRELALRHLDWCVGMNPYQCCMISGWGECEAAPQSGAVGYMPGGTYQGPIGDQDDEPYFQVGEGMRIGEEPLFNYGGPSYSREYWSPLAGALIWLRALL